MSAAATAATTREAIDALEGRYEFREPDEVRAYLAANPDLLALLDEAAAKIPEFLPPDGPLILEVVWDPEDEEGEGDELFAVVPTRMKHEEVRPRLKRLDREWFLDARGHAIGRFNVDVEHR